MQYLWCVCLLAICTNTVAETIAVKNNKASLNEGLKAYHTHCVLCHGEYGDGKGRMAKIITTPPPANLTYSRLPDDYLKKIISGGGQSMQRSPQMPPWGDEFSSTQIDSIILYIKSIRN